MKILRQLPAATLGAALLASCSSMGTNGGFPSGPPNASTSVSPARQLRANAGTGSVLATLNSEQTIGSTVPSTPGDVNPYGLDVAKTSSGKITAGDLVVCDFNDPGNVQGTGTEIVALHPVVGSTPQLIAKDNSLTGCNALVAAPNGQIWAAAFKANDNPIVSPSGSIVTTLPNGPWHHPFGEAFAASSTGGAFYVSNAADGSLVRVTRHHGTFHFTVIATGFPVNGGKPGSILSPSGLNYQPSGDILYVVDGTNNTLYAIDGVSNVGQNGLVVHNLSFSGPSASSGHVVYSGAPLNGPISSAIFPGGNIVLGNTLDPDGKNLMVEISPSGQLLDVKNVDTGPAGAIFGMVVTGSSPATTKLYFNDDNSNAVMVLSP